MLVAEEPSRPASSGARGHQRRDLEVGLWISIPVILFIVHWTQIFEQFSTVGCEGVCDLDLAFAARAAYPWEVVASVVLAIIITAVLDFQGKPTFWGSLIAVVLVLASAIVTSALFQAGLAPMYERNERIASGEVPATELAAPPASPIGTWRAGQDQPYLAFSSDGTFVGHDGCNALTGQWAQDHDGLIAFADVSATSEICDGVDTWLSQGRSGFIREDYLYINGTTVSPIGGLPPAE